MIPLSRIPHRVAVPALVALFVGCGYVSLSGDSATFDETAHLGAGVSYLETGDFRLNLQHPSLAKLIAAAPLAILHRGGGDYRSPLWTGTPLSDGDPRRSHAWEWGFGFHFLNDPAEGAPRPDPAARLIPARCAILGLGALLALVVYAWARALFGPPAGLFGLFLAVTCPTLLAHARLVTTDLPAALGFAGTTFLFWRWLVAPSWRRAAAAGAGVLAFFEPSPRILLPVLAGGCVLAAATLADWTDGGRRRWAKIGAAALVARGGLLVAGHNALFFNPVPAAVGIESERAYVARQFPQSRLYERAAALPENSVVLSVGEPRLFGFPRRSLNSAITDPPAAEHFLAKAEAPSDVLQRLRAQSVTHLLVDLDWLSRPSTLPAATAANRLTAGEEQLMRQVIGLSTPVDREGPLMLLALPP